MIFIYLILLKSLFMKRLMLYAAMLLLTAAFISSCASPRYGCPGSVQSNKPFRS
jgi:hypothetical protein